MSDSLRDQLLGLGFKPPAKPERRPAQEPVRKPANKPGHGAGARTAEGARKPASDAQRPRGKARPPQHGKPRTREEIDLAKAYAIRAQKEKDERIEAERLKQEEARKRREAKARLAELLKDKSLNDPAAEIARHFDYGGKIKRIHVNEAQLKALNAGELGVVQLDGRNLYAPADVEAAGIAYYGIGRGRSIVID
jgi:uncharacterized protein YaiL (DUF2058 family)